MDQKDQPVMPKFTVGEDKGVFSNTFNLMTILAGLITIIFTIFFCFYQLSLKNKVSDLTGQKASLLSQVQTPENVEVERNVNGIIESIEKIKTIKDSDSKKVFFALSNLPAIVLKTSQIKNLSISEDGILTLDVTTNSNENVAKFLASLSDSTFLEIVQLLATTTSGTTEAPIVDFSVTAKINQKKVVPTASTTEETAEEGTDETLGESVDSQTTATGDSESSETTSEDSETVTEPPEASL